MRLKEVAERLGLEFLVTADPEAEVRGGYVSDLLSDVLAHAEAGDLWITHQRHLNVVAVAKLRGWRAWCSPGGFGRAPRPSAARKKRA